MAYDNETLVNIFRKTDGHCHLCGKKLRLFMYNGYPDVAAWEVEHSLPKAKGGTDHFNNLFPAHIECNRERGIRHTKIIRKWFGRSSAPLSKAKKDQNRTDNTLGGVAAGAAIEGSQGFSL